MHIRDYINRIDINEIPIREIYNELYTYKNECVNEPLIMREANINHGLVNSIRHNESLYNHDLKLVKSLGKNRKERYYNYRRYKNAVLNSIAITYPFLKPECDKQKYKINLCKIRKDEKNEKARNKSVCTHRK